MVSQPPPSSLLRPSRHPPPPTKTLPIIKMVRRVKTEFDLGVIKDDPVDEKKSMDKENILPEQGLLNKKTKCTNEHFY